MPYSNFVLNEKVYVTHPNPSLHTIPPGDYEDLAPSYESMIDTPSRERRKRPKGDVFDTWTGRSLRTSSHRYLRGINQVRHPSNEYDVRVEGPYSFFAGPPTLDDHFETLSLFDDLDLSMRRRIKNTKVNLLQAAGERKQTFKLVSDLYRDLRGAAKDLVREFGTGAVRRWCQQGVSAQSKSISNRWLQYQYGIRPLMSDIYGTAETVATHLNKGFPIYLSLGRRYKSHDTNTIGIVTNEHDTQISCRLRARFKYEDSVKPNFVSLGLTNPMQLAWELTPWSFVADWAINMGDFLEGFDALLGTSDVVILRSYTKLSTVKSTVSISPKPAKAVGWARMTERWSKTNDLSYGSLRFENPFSTNGEIRAANSFALFRGRFR